MSCRGKYLHIATLMRKYTRGLSTSSRFDLLVSAAETVLTDGRTDVKKRCVFWKKLFWFGRVQIGRPFPSFGRIFPYFRTPSGRPSAKKKHIWRKKAFARLRYMGKSSVVTRIEEFNHNFSCTSMSEYYQHAKKQYLVSKKVLPEKQMSCVFLFNLILGSDIQGFRLGKIFFQYYIFQYYNLVFF